MESVLQKFKAIKEERMKFVYETQSKKDLLLSDKFLNHNQEKAINIGDISNQITLIQNFINNKDEYRKHFEYYTTSFFNYFDDRFKTIYPYYDFDNIEIDIKMLLDMTEELIKEYSLISNNNNNNNSRIINQIKENCCLLDSLLQVDYISEKEELSKLKFFANKVKEISCKDTTVMIVENDKERTMLLKSIMRYASIIIIKERNSVSKSITFNEDNSNSFMKNEGNNNYDLNIFFNDKESKKNIHKCLNFIKKNLIPQYILYYNKQQSLHIKNNTSNPFIHYGLFGIAVKSYPIFFKHLINCLKSKIHYDCLIKCSIYISIDYLLKKNLPKISNGYLINYNFDSLYLQQYLHNNTNTTNQE